jgi:16S rRNA (guanine(966)-N(2))-methyltransferase RsmD
MRIIAGTHRSRTLQAPAGLATRPTSDRLRETLFNVLAPRIQDAAFLDLYAGSGAVGIEALSRGASTAIFVDQSRTAVNTIRENLRSLALETRSTVRHGRAAAVLAHIDADIFFVDPPYKLELEYARSLTILGEKPAALLIAQHDHRLILAETYGEFQRTRVLKHGDNALSFYERNQ